MRLGALGAGLLVGSGGVIFALALCAVVPAVAPSRGDGAPRAANPRPRPEQPGRVRYPPIPRRSCGGSIEEVINDGRLEVIDELYAPAMRKGRGAGSRRSVRASPTCRWRSSSSSPKARRSSGASAARPPTSARGAVSRQPAGASSASTRSTSSASATAGSSKPGASRTLAHASANSDSHPAADSRSSHRSPAARPMTSTPPVREPVEQPRVVRAGVVGQCIEGVERDRRRRRLQARDRCW